MKPMRDIAHDRGVALLFGVDHARMVAGMVGPDAFCNPASMAHAFVVAHGTYCHDLVIVHSDAFVCVEAAGGRVTLPDRGPPILVARPPIPERPLDPWRDGRLPVLMEAACLVRRRLEGRAETAVSLTGPFTLAAAVQGEAAALRAVPFTSSASQALMTWAEESVSRAVRAAADEGLGVMVAEPLAALLSPCAFAQVVAESLRRILACGGDIVHICGDSSHLLPILPSLGGGAFSLDRVDLTKASHALQGRAVLMGGPSSELVRAGPLARVSDAARECAKVEPAIIPCNGCDLAWDTPVAHGQAFVRGARAQQARSRGMRCDESAGSSGRSLDAGSPRMQ